MQHIDNMIQLIKDQGWNIKDAYKIGLNYYLLLEDSNSNEKEVMSSISKDEELEYIKENK